MSKKNPSFHAHCFVQGNETDMRRLGLSYQKVYDVNSNPARIIPSKVIPKEPVIMKFAFQLKGRCTIITRSREETHVNYSNRR